MICLRLKTEKSLKTVFLREKNYESKGIARIYGVIYNSQNQRQ